MIAANRRMPAQDFLLIAFSVAVIVLSKWPETQPRQWVQLRGVGGTLRQYSLVENDPQLSKLRLSLEKWARAGQETRLAVAVWRAELADFYASKNEPTPARETTDSPFRSVAFRNQSTLTSDGAELAKAHEEQVRQSQREYWLKFGQQARAEIERVEEIRRSRRALEVPPPIVFGPMEPGRKPMRAILIAPAFGGVVAMGFGLWSLLCPTLRLRDQQPAGAGISSAVPHSSGGAHSSAANQADAASQLRLVVPSHWVRVRQPLGVLARWSTMAALAVWALVSIIA